MDVRILLCPSSCHYYLLALLIQARTLTSVTLHYTVTASKKVSVILCYTADVRPHTPCSVHMQMCRQKCEHFQIEGHLGPISLPTFHLMRQLSGEGGKGRKEREEGRRRKREGGEE